MCELKGRLSALDDSITSLVDAPPSLTALLDDLRNYEVLEALRL